MWPFNKKSAPSVPAVTEPVVTIPAVLPRRRSFQGATFGRLVSDWVSVTTSQDAEVRSSLLALRNRSRQLGRDNDHCKNFFARVLPNNIVGQGIPFQAQVKMQRKDALDTATNDLIENAWARWCRADSCHTAGKLRFEDIERLIIRSVAESGEILIRMVYQKFGDSRIPFALELLESDLLDETYNGQAPETGNRIIMGVEMNQWKRPVAYYFRTRHPGDINLQGTFPKTEYRIRIPAEEILHPFITERVDQTRGIPWLASTIMRLHHMQGYEESEVIAARASAALMGFIETPEGEPSMADDVDGGESVTEFQPGLFKTLAPGEKVNIPQLSRPGGQFDPFMRLMLRGVAAGAGASYESLSRDYSQSNYSSSRLALIEDRDNWRSIQGWMIANFHQRVFERWLDMAVLSGALVLRNYETNPEMYQAVKWMPRGWSWVDPEKEVNAYKSAVRAGFMTQTDVVAQSGGDIDEMLAQRKREIDSAKKLGLVFDTDAAETDDKGQLQGAPAVAAGEPATTAPQKSEIPAGN